MEETYGIIDGVHIGRVSNGFILAWRDEEGGPSHFQVIEDSEDDNLKSSESLLCEIMEFFNLGGSKHDPVRIEVVRLDKNGDLV